jgi:hypothetical protein
MIPINSMNLETGRGTPDSSSRSGRRFSGGGIAAIVLTLLALPLCAAAGCWVFQRRAADRPSRVSVPPSMAALHPNGSCTPF